MAAITTPALLETDPRLLTSAERRDRLQHLQALAARVEAAHLDTLVAECGAAPRERTVIVDAPSDADAEREAHRLGTGTGVRGPRLETGERQLVFTDEVVDELGPLLHRTHGSVANDLRVARLLNGPLSAVRESLIAGRITAAHARALCRQASRMQPDDVHQNARSAAEFAERCARFQKHLIPIAESSTHGRTESQAERLVARIDVAGERSRRRRARARIDVTAQSEGDGLMSITAVLSSVDAARIMAVVDSQARSRRREQAEAIAAGASDVERLTLGQHRARALLGMLGLSGDDGARSVTPEPTPGQVRAEISVVIDAATLLGLTGGAVDVPGWVRVGSAAPGAVDRDEILTLLADPTVPTTLRRLISDPATGALIDRGAHTYTPTPELVAWLVARDGGCRFPGCTARAILCDVDHAEDFSAGGWTSIANTGLLCRRHHNGKTHGGWRIVDSAADGSCVFIAPDGTRHRHRPAPLLNPPTLDP